MKHPCFLDKNADHFTAGGKSASGSGSLGPTALNGFSKMPRATRNVSTKGFLKMEVYLCGNSLISFSNSIHGL